MNEQEQPKEPVKAPPVGPTGRERHQAMLEGHKETKAIRRERHTNSFYRRIAKMAPNQLI